MSVLGDAVQTLNEDIEVAAFLPGANFVFLLISPGGDPTVFLALAILSAVVGAGFFNYLSYLSEQEGSHVEENKDEVGGSDSTGAGTQPVDRQGGSGRIDLDVASLFLLVPWAILLVIGMYFLLERFERNWILPEILFFVSFGFICLYPTEYLLKRFVSGYRE